MSCVSGELSETGEEATGTREAIPGGRTVIQAVQEKFDCRACEKIGRSPAPFQPALRVGCRPTCWRRSRSRSSDSKKRDAMVRDGRREEVDALVAKARTFQESPVRDAADTPAGADRPENAQAG